MAIQSQPSRISEPFAGSGTKNTIPATNATPSASQAASWASGFPPECSQPISAGGCPVPRNDMNGVLNQLSQDFAFRQDGGVWEWSALADYDASRMVRGSDGSLYFSVQQSGPSTVAGAQDPTADNGIYWTAVSVDDSNVVHRTGDETVAGVKTFTSGRIISEKSYSDKPDILCRYSDFAIQDSTQSATHFAGFYIVDKNNVALGYAEYAMYSSGSGVLRLRARENSAGDIHASVLVACESGSKSFKPDGNGGTTLGTASNRWGQIYSTSSTISTSDARQKTSPEPLPDAVLDAWGEISFAQFQMLDSVAVKGEANARLHSGLIAQQIDAVFKARGLDASRYGLFCWDEWDANPDQGIEDPGDQYSLRYEEALCMEAAYQRRRADRAEARLAALEERLAAIEDKLNTQP